VLQRILHRTVQGNGARYPFLMVVSFGGNDSINAFHLFSLAGIDADDFSAGVRAAQDFTVSILGKTISKVYLAVPVTFSVPSTRCTFLPITEYFSLILSPYNHPADCFDSRRMLLYPVQRQNIAVMPSRICSGVGLGNIQQPFAGHQHTGGAETALIRAVIQEGFL